MPGFIGKRIGKPLWLTGYLFSLAKNFSGLLRIGALHPGQQMNNSVPSTSSLIGLPMAPNWPPVTGQIDCFTAKARSSSVSMANDSLIFASIFAESSLASSPWS